MPSSPLRAAATSTRSSPSSTPTSSYATDRGATPSASREVRGAATVAKQSLLFSSRAHVDRIDHRAIVNGGPGIIVWAGGKPLSVLGFTVAGGKIVEIDILADPERLRLVLPPM